MAPLSFSFAVTVTPTETWIDLLKSTEGVAQYAGEPTIKNALNQMVALLSSLPSRRTRGKCHFL
jgi:hypothetical protein